MINICIILGVEVLIIFIFGTLTKKNDKLTKIIVIIAIILGVVIQFTTPSKEIKDKFDEKKNQIQKVLSD